MKRRLFTTILSALSLLLFVAVVVLWVRSDRGEYWERVAYTADDRVFRDDTLVSNRGILRFSSHRDRIEASLAPTMERMRDEGRYPNMWNYGRGIVWSPGPPRTQAQRLGFWFEYHRNDNSQFARRFRSGMTIAAPHWFIAALSLLLPFAWVGRCWKRLNARRVGLCPSCGYDLRATPGRCPECGLVPAAPPPLLRGNDQ